MQPLHNTSWQVVLPAFTSAGEHSGCGNRGGVRCCLHKREHISFYSTAVTEVWPRQTFAGIMITSLEEAMLHDTLPKSEESGDKSLYWTEMYFFLNEASEAERWSSTNTFTASFSRTHPAAWPAKSPGWDVNVSANHRRSLFYVLKSFVTQGRFYHMCQNTFTLHLWPDLHVRNSCRSQIRRPSIKFKSWHHRIS